MTSTDSIASSSPRPSSLALWCQALSFHARHAPSLLLLSPCFIVPVLCDALHTILLRQAADDGRLAPREALGEALLLTPSLAAVKLRSEIKGVVFAFLRFPAPGCPNAAEAV
jgi:hypothetical protein